ncbi:MAG: PLP-dependent transferase [Arenicellales bacterium]|nr:PLP-dependent transferase [Arenicellales bacterium]
MTDQSENKKKGRNTLAVHAGEGLDPNTRASAPNIVMLSTFVLDEPVGFSAYDSPDEAPYIYSRWCNPAVQQLEEKLSALEMDTDDLMSSSYQLSGKQLQAYRDFAGDGVYRVFVGLEDPEDPCEDLARVLG